MGSVELVDPTRQDKGWLRQTGIARLGASWLFDGRQVLVAGGLVVDGEEGGRLAGEVLSLDVEGDCSPQRWNACTARYLQAEVASGAGVWVLAGGLVHQGEELRATAVVERVDTRRQVVEALPRVPFSAAEALAVALDDGRVLVAGGYDENVQTRAAVSKADGSGWDAAPDLPAPRAGCAAPIALDRRFLLFAGGAAGLEMAPARDALLLEPRTLKWQVAEIEIPAGAAITALNGGLLASGGRDEAGEPIGDNTLWTWTAR